MYFIFNLLSNLIYIYSIILGIYALMSWFPGAYQTSFGRLVTNVVDPYLRLFRRLPLQFFGLDFTVLVAILSLNFLYRLLIFLFMLFL